MITTGKNDFGIHAVFKTREYYMIKLKTGKETVKIPPELELVLDRPVEKRKGFTKIHLKPNMDETKIVTAMNYFEFMYK